MDILTIALTVAVIVFIIAWAVALGDKDKMKLTAESAIMRNDELKKQLEKERDLAKKRVKTLESCETKIRELENIITDGKAHNKSLIDRLNEAEKDIRECRDAKAKMDGKIAQCANEYNECAKLRDQYKQSYETSQNLAADYAKSITRLEREVKELEKFKLLAEEGERTIQDQAKKIEELTKGDANGEVTRGKRGRFASKKAS